MAEATKKPAWSRPLPQPDKVTKHFWDAAAREELVIQRCTSCGHHQFYPRVMCTACAGPVEWVTASGRGEVHTFTVIRQNKSMPEETPYVVAMVELEEGEGVRMMTNIIECHPDDVHIGMPVEVHFAEATPDVKVPFWRPRS